MKYINVDEMNVEYIVEMKKFDGIGVVVYTYKYFVNNEELNENKNLLQDIVMFFEKMHKGFKVSRIITDISVPCGISYNPRYYEVYPNLKLVE